MGEIQDRIARSTEIGECRVKKMKNRDDLLKQLVKEAGSKCAMVARGRNYPQLLQKLIVQSLIKIEDVDIIEKESGIKLKPNVTVNDNAAKDLPETSYGGVILTAEYGKIVGNNTMSARLNLVYEELLPSLRAILFPSE